MKTTEAIRDLFAAISAIVSPGDAARVMRSMTALVGAEHYLLLDIPPTHAPEHMRVIASNWPHDTVEIIGLETVARLAGATGAAQLGATSSQFVRLAGASQRVLFGPERARLLDEFGHRELVAARIHAGLGRGLLVFSSPAEDRIGLDQLPRIQLLCCHVWSKLSRGAASAQFEDPLSERERECLSWVSEGKTTEEVAVILDVSANTVNRYILHATQKLSAANRSMAIALAIRNGII
ncbi:helix-turn-helix transcriptional regulator [Mesorhizobium sp. L-8-10]|uniref:helix-turn-helix transcriptional regulator n=1 Tax=unclassified Mesorhizobium TaxID=325217 RepID=UPI0019267564|nr:MULTISPECIES: helix-turn-helix domain-containing protein [unclassified Mesorhizobium]BCH23171.1 helix-turn-helix transcriptional regulator [Mesorhizobium sp. L-8-3]BCH30979.1 helix-turn-helix transcriptional regulator [Mesorhizobium sp. L-8-10]